MCQNVKMFDVSTACVEEILNDMFRHCEIVNSNKIKHSQLKVARDNNLSAKDIITALLLNL